MIELLQRDLLRMQRAKVSAAPVQLGRVVSCDGGLIEVSGLPVPIGALCRIETSDEAPACTAEVVGFRHGHSLMMLLGDTVMLKPDAVVRAIGHPGMVAVGEALLGRAIDGSGRPIDNGMRPKCDDVWPLGGQRDHALERSSVIEPFDCGIRAINSLTTMGVGQRLGIIAGSGVGKSVLIDMMAAGAEADIKIIALIGERAREVSDFVRRHMQGDEAKRTILIAVPADHAPNLRLRGAQYACAIAEYFRARGKRVLLVLDSLTRVAHAAREIGFLLGEPGAARGYPPSALATITRLVERAGNSATSGGAVTGLYTVLADGDDQDDPVVDTARAIFDGHIVLSRDLAQQGQYPAIDITASLSRVMDGLVTEEHRRAAREFRQLVAHYQANHELVMMGAYREGSHPLLDRALSMKPQLDAFLAQEAGDIVGLEASTTALCSVIANAK
ncbi:FliI/YscN family ATPase [Parerythrobacter jejuensis]|uniref:Flagellum-specific ATP synthase n=1 Tax=Parerythrobacter jejuensis TaxID=795812 RepID=A0A845ALX6_9SPHN|nr:FliI/YscN family ATPase [Parerythrobacter jejuensis]MXP30614.1 FliI/YscN family ATPase [Parerythrobacter jejuensis]MXP33374.1 FliI/YscN family ATPase [Parerythrobacter jejuensis]